MKRMGQNQGLYSESSEPYILFLVGIHNLIFVDVSLVGMPLRTLFLLVADFLCIAVQLCKGERLLLHWRDCHVYERTMAVLLAVSVVVLLFFAFTGSDDFWIYVDMVALLLIDLCVRGRKSFPQDIFSVYSVCSFVTCLLLLCYYLTGGICEPFVALLLQDGAAVSWLVLGIMMNTIAYCFQERGQAWYGGNILLAAFLLAIQKNLPAMIIAGLVSLLLPVFCRPSKLLVCRAAQAGFLYAFLICNMSLITGCITTLEGIVTYDLGISVYLELWLAAMGIWFFNCWDRYAKEEDADVTLPQMREWYRKAAVVYLLSIAGMFTASGLFCADDASTWKGAAQVIMGALEAGQSWKSGLPGQMGQYYGVLGVAVAGVLFYIGVVQIYRAKRWRVKAHKLYRLIVTVCLMQAAFLPQTMVSLPVYIIFFFLFMETEEEQTQKITSDEWRNTDETDHTDSLLQ